MEAIEQSYNGTADYGRRIQCQISRNGDLMSRMYLQVGIDAIKKADGTAASTGSAFKKYLGISLINNVEIEIGGQRIDKHYSEWMFIWNELSLPYGKKNGWDTLIQKAPADVLAKNVYVPLEFWFCRNPGVALPLIALQYHDVKINVEFESKSTIATIAAGDAGAAMNSMKIWVDYIYLDTDERRRFAQLSHEYLVEILQFTGDETIRSNKANPKLSFNHPCKALYWVIKNSDVAAEHKHDFTTGGDHEVALDRAKLLLNGQDRFSEREGDYFNLVQPFQHHENTPVGLGIYMYSFALKPEEHQPSGSLNMSRIDSAVLNINTVSAVPNGTLKIFALSYNVLRIMSGMGGVAYSN